MTRLRPFCLTPFCIHFELSAHPCLDAVSVLPQVQVPIGPEPGGAPGGGHGAAPRRPTRCAKRDPFWSLALPCMSSCCVRTVMYSEFESARSTSHLPLFPSPRTTGILHPLASVNLGFFGEAGSFWRSRDAMNFTSEAFLNRTPYCRAWDSLPRHIFDTLVDEGPRKTDGELLAVACLAGNPDESLELGGQPAAA